MSVTRTKVGECRQCRSFCDKMVEPRGCVELGCRYLYSYVDRHCLHSPTLVRVTLIGKV